MSDVESLNTPEEVFEALAEYTKKLERENAELKRLIAKRREEKTDGIV